MQKFCLPWTISENFKEWVIQAPESKKALCKFCHVNLLTKKSVLIKHQRSKSHIDARITIKGTKKLNVLSDKKELDVKIKVAEARYALYTACHTSISCSNHLIECNKEAFPDSEISNSLKSGRTKCSAIIKNVLAPHFLKDLQNDVQDGVFSLIVDESTDVSIIKYLGIVVRYFSISTAKIVTTFLKLSHIDSCDADGITNAIKFTLAELKLDIRKLVGLGTDNASVMVGINNGVFKKLSESAPSLTHIPCVCHSLQLAVSEATKQCLPRNLEFLVSETYNWFARSSARQQSYKNIYNLINNGSNPLKITQISQTRWMSIEIAVSRIFTQ